MTAVEFEIDTTSGLPVLPEGYFWRIGDVEVSWGGYSTIKRPGVSIMKGAEMVTKTRKVPVYGSQWWNKNQVVDEFTETYVEMDGPTERLAITFSDLTTTDKTTIPNFARDRGSSSVDGKPYQWHYDVPVGKEGAAYLAGRLYKIFLEDEERRKRNEAFKKALAATKEEIYGDYPPKTLK